jgi:hypothetical protein
MGSFIHSFIGLVPGNLFLDLFSPAGEENIQDHAYKYLTTEEMKGLGDDSMQIDVTNDEKDKKDTLNRSGHFTTLRNSPFVFFVLLNSLFVPLFSIF